MLVQTTLYIKTKLMYRKLCPSPQVFGGDKIRVAAEMFTRVLLVADTAFGPLLNRD